MKKLILSLIVLFIVVPFMRAQDVHGGVTLGVNLCSVATANDDPNEKMLIGGKMGFPVNIPVTDAGPFGFSIQPELNFTMKGSRSQADSDNKSSFYYNYVELPVMAKFRLGSDDFKIFFNTGPYLAYHVVYFSTITIAGTTNNSDAETPDPDLMNLMDFGWNVGVGMNAGGFLLEVRYGIGFSNIYKDYELLGQTIDMKSQNRVLNFSIGFLLPE